MHASAPAELAARIFELVEDLRRRSGCSAFALLERSGVTPGQWKALHVLTERNAPVSVGELADALSLTPPTASRTVDALAQRGFVDRQVSSEDRRARDLVVTAAGRDLVRRLTEARIADLQVAVDGLSDEQRVSLAGTLAELGMVTDDARTPAHV